MSQCHVPGVIDPRTEKEISLSDAIKEGIIKSETGMYVNLATGDSYPIPVAMNAGQIKVRVMSCLQHQCIELLARDLEQLVHSC